VYATFCHGEPNKLKNRFRGEALIMACKCKTEVYSRVVGYYRPVQQWNKGKQAEYHDRVPFKVQGVAFANVGALAAAEGEKQQSIKSA